MLHRAFVRGIHADPQPRVFRRPQVVLDVAQAVVPAMRPPGPHPQLAQRQVDVVADDQQLRQRQLVEVHYLPDAAAAQVHERLRLDEKDLFSVLGQLGDLRLETALEPATARPSREGVDDVVADVVPRPLVVPARIAQPDDDFHTPNGEVGMGNGE